MTKVLILSTTDSVRSQIVRAYLQYYARARAQVFSAGLKESKINPLVNEVMKEVGLDISDQTTHTLDEFDTQDFDYIITVSDTAKAEAPYLYINGLKVFQPIKGISADAKTKGQKMDELRRICEDANILAHKFSKVHFKGLKPPLK